jgi:hypothetical protein
MDKPECKGKRAARALAVIVLTPTTRAFLQANDPKALEQAEESLKAFGYPEEGWWYKLLPRELRNTITKLYGPTVYDRLKEN